MSTEQIVNDYYSAWVNNDRDAARALLADNLIFRAPTDKFDSADEFMNTCWQYAEALTELKWEHTVFGEEAAYISYHVGGMVVGEFIRVSDGRISAIYVTFNVTV